MAMQKYIRTGGKESPHIWNQLMRDTMGEVVQKWELQASGVELREASTPWAASRAKCRVAHFVHADNVFLLSSSAGELAGMVRDLTKGIREQHLNWKESSLEYMVGWGPL